MKTLGHFSHFSYLFALDNKGASDFGELICKMGGTYVGKSVFANENIFVMRIHNENDRLSSKSLLINSKFIETRNSLKIMNYIKANFDTNGVQRSILENLMKI